MAHLCGRCRVFDPSYSCVEITFLDDVSSPLCRLTFPKAASSDPKGGVSILLLLHQNRGNASKTRG